MKPPTDAGPKLTVAIPFYSNRHFLRQAVESVLRQTSPDWALLVCDDHGPEEGLAEWVASYADPRLTYVRNPAPLGMAGNWNRCLDLARTDLVTVLHADDELGENYCALMLAGAVRWPKCVALFCGAAIIDEHGTGAFSFADAFKRLLLPPGHGPVRLQGPNALAALLRGNFIMCPTVCYRKSVLGGRRFSQRWRFVQDLDLYCRLLLGGETLVGLRPIGYAYRRHPDNATRRYEDSLLRFREEAALYEAVAKEAAGRRWTRAARVARSGAIIKLNLLYGLFDHLAHGRWGPAWRRLIFLGSLL
jgi:glycosyltransferase involved in cell wall biosynthesis